MKKQAICIQCHTKPEMVNFLIDCFPSDKYDFYIHVDKKSNIINDIVKKPNVFFAERYDVQWGRFSQVEATLSMLKMIDTDKYSYIHLSSGNCFIAKSIREFTDFFENTDKEYIESNIIGAGTACTWSWHGEDRYACYYPQWIIRRPREKFYRFLRVLYREFIMRTKIFKRKHFPVTAFYGGSSWFSITGKALKWMLNYLDEHKEYSEHFKHGVCVDEVFFSTLIRCSPYADNIYSDSLRFMKWKGASTGGPATILPDDFENIINSHCMWTRKIDDLEVSKQLFSKLTDR